MKKIFPHIFVLFAFIFMFALGTWQVARLEYKEELIAKVNAHINGEPISPADYKNLEEDEYKIMRASGEFVNDKTITVINKSLNGKAGTHLLQILKTDDGQKIVVNRGWTVSDADPVLTKGKVEITGIIRATQKPNWIGKFVFPDNDPTKNFWFWVELPKVESFLGADNKDYYLEQVSAEKPTTYPYAFPKEINLYNEHLQYSITWYSLSVILLVMYYFRFFYKK